MSYQEFETLKWLPVTERFNQRANSIILKYVKNHCPNYMKEVYEIAPEKNIETYNCLKPATLLERNSSTGLFL